jgi:hypothetical protein
LLTSAAEVLTIFSLLFMIKVLFNFIGSIAAGLAIMTDCLYVNGYLTFPGIKALQSYEINCEFDIEYARLYNFFVTTHDYKII